jgi:hypothetical protein
MDTVERANAVLKTLYKPTEEQFKKQDGTIDYEEYLAATQNYEAAQAEAINIIIEDG